MVTKKREMVLDNYKGILIFLVVFAHFLFDHSREYPGTIIDRIVVFIYFFHMPAFIFCSGYLSKSVNSRSYKTIFKLLIYYLIFNFIMMIYMYFYDGTEFIFLTPYNSYWYLLSLIFWRFFIKYLNKVRFIIPISIIIALLIGFYSEFSNFLSIRRTIAFFPFFLIGYKLAQKDFLTNIKSSKNVVKTIIIVLLTIAFSLFLYLVITKYQFTSSMLIMSTYKENNEFFYRVFILFVAFIMMFLLLFICPNRFIPIITKAGKNSLGIYVFHRFITFEFLKVFDISNYSNKLILYAFVAATICVIVLGMDTLNKWLNDRVNSIAFAISNGTKKGKLIEIVALLLFVMALLFAPINSFINYTKEVSNNQKNVFLNINKNSSLSSNMQKKIKNAIKISYVGDLILLKDQVTSAYNEETKEYDFNDMFKYTKKYFDSSDLSIGVFEGPTAGSKLPYSTSNYGDGIKFYLNFPDSFAKAVKDSGIDVVTTANNHLLDGEYDGAIRTIDILDKYKIDHVGSYKNQKEKDNLFIVDVKGVKIAVLSYVSALNYYNLDEVYEKYPSLTSIIPKDDSRNYQKMYKDIENDFKKAKESDADLIMVMPHMGTQFTHTTNAFQRKWNKVFSDLGADIILGDHAHAVQPIEYIGNTIVVNCPGNFANSYVKYDGDATSIVNIYIDKKDKNVIASGVVPMYTQEYKDGYFRALPIYDIMNDKKLYDSMSDYDLKRIEEISNMITKVMINKRMSLDNIESSYFFIKNNCTRESNFSETIKKYKDKKLYQLIENSNSIVFIGDSITEGTKNSFHPYYEPLMNAFQDKRIINISKGSYTTKMILRDYSDKIRTSDGDLYVIALGTNDIRYRNSRICAFTSNEYVSQINKIVKLIKSSSDNPSIVLIAPWFSLSDDSISRLNENDKRSMMKDYSYALEKYSFKNGYLYINPNEYLESVVRKNRDRYMVDYIHPNDNDGIKLYSEAILRTSK